jgi:hypothetical protein
MNIPQRAAYSIERKPIAAFSLQELLVEAKNLLSENRDVNLVSSDLLSAVGTLCEEHLYNRMDTQAYD